MDELLKLLFPDQSNDYDDMHWMENGTMVYTTRYIDMYGEPDTPFPYRVIEDRCDNLGYLDFKDEVILKKKRPTHFYCRLNHFRIILTHILGYNGRVPIHVLNLMPDWCEDGTHWEVVRKILKSNGLQSYYNRIFTIIKLKGYLRNLPPITEKIVNNVFYDFKKLNDAWPYYPTKRTYFPILRFVALRLLYENGYDLSLIIPWARTVKKYNELEEEFSNLWDFADNLHIEKMYYDKKYTPKTHKDQCRHCKHNFILISNE